MHLRSKQGPSAATPFSATNRAARPASDSRGAPGVPAPRDTAQNFLSSFFRSGCLGGPSGCLAAWLLCLTGGREIRGTRAREGRGRGRGRGQGGRGQGDEDGTRGRKSRRAEGGGRGGKPAGCRHSTKPPRMSSKASMRHMRWRGGGLLRVPADSRCKVIGMFSDTTNPFQTTKV